jgi:hypothetical protein
MARRQDRPRPHFWKRPLQLVRAQRATFPRDMETGGGKVD